MVPASVPRIPPPTSVVGCPTYGRLRRIGIGAIPVTGWLSFTTARSLVFALEERMVVDSGASAISVPSALARKLGVEPASSDPDIMVGMADGRRIPAKLVRLDSVRVGRFTAEDVECIVLGPEATDAPPLLGMSFLGQYKFELDAGAAPLKMVKVDSGEPAPTAKAMKKKKPK